MYKTIKTSIKPLIQDKELYKKVKAEIKKVIKANEDFYTVYFKDVSLDSLPEILHDIEEYYKAEVSLSGKNSINLHVSYQQLRPIINFIRNEGSRIYGLVIQEIPRYLGDITPVKAEAGKQFSIDYTIEESDFKDIETAFDKLGVPLSEDETAWDVEVFATAQKGYKSSDWYQPDEPPSVEDMSVILKYGEKECDVFDYLTDSVVKRISEKFLDAYFEEPEREPSESQTKPSQMEIGKEIEREHVETLKFLLKECGIDPESEKGQKLIEKGIEMIAGDHIDEFPEYYDALVEMEKKLKEGKK